MKKLLISLFAFSFVFIACNAGGDKKEAPKTQETKTETFAPVAAEMYSCPMHPEVTGKKGDKCSKCGMNLSVEVKKTDTPK